MDNVEWLNTYQRLIDENRRQAAATARLDLIDLLIVKNSGLVTDMGLFFLKELIESWRDELNEKEGN